MGYRDPRRRDERIACLAVPQHPDNVRHETQYAACTLELFQACPILGEAVEELWVDGIGKAQQFQIPRLFRLRRELGRVLPVKVVKSPDSLVPCLLTLGIK